MLFSTCYIFTSFHKRAVFIPIQKKGNTKICSNYCTIVIISLASKVMLKILPARLQQYMNWELTDVQAGFRKGRRTTDQITNIRWIIEKAREFQKKDLLLLVCITTNCGKFFKLWEYQNTLPASREICMQWLEKQWLELDMEQWTGSKFGKGFNKAIYYHPVYLI